MSNKTKREELYRLYGRVCMLTGESESLTYHHLDKVCDGGATTVLNGAVLSESSQAWLHNLIEINDPALYELLNDCICLYKMVMDLGEVCLIEQYRQEVMPEAIRRIKEYDNYRHESKGYSRVRRKR